MKKLIIGASILLVFLVCLQSIWFSEAFDATAAQFDHSVSVALYTVADTMSEHASVEKKSANYFYVTANSPVSSQKVDTMIRKEFTARNIQLDYEIGVYNAEDDSLVYGNYVKTASINDTRIGSGKTDGINKNFAILFPSRKSYLMSQIDFWVFIPIVLIIVSWSYFHLILRGSSPLSLRNRNLIRLGNSSLDYHNRSLVVNRHSYQLTYKESKILKLFFENPNQVIDREVFLKTVWEQEGFFVARSMDVFISKIRKYLSMDNTVRIENLRSIGYRLHVSR